MLGQILSSIFNSVFGNQGGIATEATEQAAIVLEEERLRDEAERARQQKKTAPPGTQTIPKPSPSSPIPTPPKAPPLTPVEPDDDITVLPPAKGKAKDINFAPNPGTPQKPIWEDPVNAFRNWVFPSAGNTYVKLGTLLRTNYLKGDTTFFRWKGITNPPDYFNQVGISYSNFLAWLAKKTGAASSELGDLGGQIDQFWDQSATIWFNNAGQMDGRKGLIYGIEPLGIIFQDYWVNSRTAQFGDSRGMLYQSITVENFPAPWSRDLNNNLEDLDSQSGEGLAYGLAMYMAQSGNLEQGESDQEPRVILENSGGVMGGADGAFPIRVPVSLLIEDEDLENMSEQEIQEKAYTKVKSLPELILWFVRVFDEVMGKFPLTFEVVESDVINLKEEMEAWESAKSTSPDPSLPFYLQKDKIVSFYMKGSKRVKRLKFPNLAEALAELSSIGIVQTQNTSIIQQFLVRLLQEGGSTKQTALQTYYMTDAVLDWLGFKTKEKSLEVDFGWNPQVEGTDYSIKDLLEPRKVPVIIVEEDEKENFQKYLNVLIEAHAIVKAAHTEGVGAVSSQLKNRIVKFAESYEPNQKIDLSTLAESGEVVDETITTEFDQFLDRVEKGFTDAPYISDATKPYGKPYKNRPKIKRVEGDLVD